MAEHGGTRLLITGATGNVGMPAIRALVRLGAAVRAASTDPGRARQILGGEAEVVRFDYRVPATFDAALNGVGGVFLLRPPAMSDPREMRPFLERARSAGVRHMVFLSLLGIEYNPITPHYRIEKFIKHSGVPCTFLRPSFFMQNLSATHRDDIRLRRDLFVPAGFAKVSFVDTRDIGEAAAAVLMEPERHRNAAYTLTGPEALTYAQAADVFTEVLGTPITYSNPSPGRFRKDMVARGVSGSLANFMTALYFTTKLGMTSKVTDDLERLLGRPPRSLGQFVRDYAGVWKP